MPGHLTMSRYEGIPWQLGNYWLISNVNDASIPLRDGNDSYGEPAQPVGLEQSMLSEAKMLKNQ